MNELKTVMTETGPQFRVTLGELAQGLTRIPIALLGRFVKGKQKFAITKQTLTELVSNFRKRQADTVIDYEHASEHPGDALGGAIPASGWLKAMDDAPDADGVLWGEAEFTDRARHMIEAKEYRYLSPVIVWSARDKGTGEPQGATLTSMALTNRPFLESMPAIALSDAEWNEIDRGDAGDAGRKEKRVTKVILHDRVARTARVVQEDGTESTVTIEGLEAPSKVIRLSDVKRDGNGRLDVTSLETGEGVVIMSEVFTAVQAESEVEAAIAAGKVLPAQRPFYQKMALSDLAGFRGLVATMKPAVDTREHGHGGDGAELTELQRLDAELEAKVGAKLKADPTKQYHEALKLVASENPDLDRRRTALIREKGGKA